jgi:ribosome-associated protein
MVSERRLDVAPGLTIPWSELEFQATRSGGPGGQHVNTSSTRVELRWNLSASPSLTESQRDRLRSRLAGRLSAEGTIRVVASATRSQHRNRELAIERLQALVAKALQVARPRKPTRPTRASRERRLDSKRRRGAIKRERRADPDQD